MYVFIQRCVKSSGFLKSYIVVVGQSWGFLSLFCCLNSCTPVRCANRLWLEQKREWTRKLSAPRWYIPCLAADWLTDWWKSWVCFSYCFWIPLLLLFLFWPHSSQRPVHPTTGLWMSSPRASLFQSPLLFTVIYDLTYAISSLPVACKHV